MLVKVKVVRMVMAGVKALRFNRGKEELALLVVLGTRLPSATFLVLGKGNKEAQQVRYHCTHHSLNSCIHKDIMFRLLHFNFAFS